MDKLNLPSPTNGIPFNWDDLEYFLGQGSYDAGINQVLTLFFSLFGDNFIISGCTYGSYPTVNEGWIFFDGEILKVDSHLAGISPTEDYFEKVTTNNSDGNKQTQLSGSVDIYQKNRGEATAVIGNLSLQSGDIFVDKLKDLLVASTTTTGVLEIATNSEVQAGVDTERAITSSGLASKDGGLIATILDIGDWDMDSDSNKNVTHGITLSKVRSCDIVIRNDSDSARYPIYYDVGGTGTEGSFSLTATEVQMTRLASGYFHSTSFNSTSYNRGYIIIKSIP